MSQNTARQPVPVGKYFLDLGQITEEQLDLALRHRQEFNLKLGQSLVELGLVTEADMVEALRNQARFPCIHLTTGIVDFHVAKKLGETLSRRLHAIALNQIAGHTTVALEDPNDGAALEELGHNIGTRIFPVYAEPSAIRKILDQVFGQRGAPASPPKARAPLPAPAPSRTGDSPLLSTVFLAEQAAREQPKEPVPVAPPEPAVDERAIVEKVRGFLQEAFAQGVSDIHLEAGREDLRVRFRVDGALREHSRLPRSWARPTLACLKSLSKLDSPASSGTQGTIPFVFKQQSFEVHVATTPSLHGESAVLHVVRGLTGRRKLADLGLTDDQRARLEEIGTTRTGLVLVAGPVGSGRTTVLHALLERFVAAERKIVALQQRTAHEIEGVLHVQLDPRAEGGYATAARTLLRQAPDVMLLGEIDGRDTAQAALEIARAGRVVLAAVHANGALAAVARLLSHGLEPYLFADALRAVISQRLVRRVCTECKQPMVPDEALRTRLDLPRDATYYEGEGCVSCNYTGYSGRFGLFEVLETTPALRHELERGPDHDALARAAREGGFTALRENGLRQARTGTTTLHEVLAATGGG